MNNQVVASLALGASAGALISFAVTRRHYTKAIDEEFEALKRYYYDKGLADGKDQKTVEEEPEIEAPQDGEGNPLPEEIREELKSERRVISYEQFVKEHEDDDFIPEDELNAEMNESDIQEYNPKGERFEIEDEDTYYLMQGYQPGELFYDRKNDMVYTSDGEQDTPGDAWYEIKESEYGFSKWPLSARDIDQIFTLIDNEERRKILVTVPAVFDIDNIL